MNRTAFVLLTVFAVACGGSPYPGYKEVGKDVHMRYITLGEGESLAADSDSVQIRFRAAVLGAEPGSYWSTERWYLAKDLRYGALVPLLGRLHQGDSMSVITTASHWPWAAMALGDIDGTTDTTTLRTELSLLAIRTPERMRADAEHHKRTDPEGYERRLISKYIERSMEAWIRWGTSDLHYIITGTPVDTNRIRPGHLVELAWTGRRLDDGQVFDENGMQGAPFLWNYGTPDQLVNGMEVAVSLLREGQDGRFILPSSMAFGATGIAGALDPWSPVLYTIHVKRVDRGH